MVRFREVLFGIFIITNARCERWSQIRCDLHVEHDVRAGIVDDNKKFPWLGLVIYNFYLGGKTRSVMTGGVLIHPRYAIAPAEDIGKIPPESVSNSTRFVVHIDKQSRHVYGLIDYALHPDYISGATYATLALLELSIGIENSRPVPMQIKPICLPLKGIGTFDDLYVVKFTDERGEMEKSVMKMNYVGETDCAEFYMRAQLTYKRRAPIDPICAVASDVNTPCVWEGGYVLVSRQSWGYWKLIGFGVRGPGCGAPSRFININRYMTWIDVMISPRGPDTESGRRLLYIERRAPEKIVLYPADIKVPVDQGQCERKDRGYIIFKDSSELLMTKNFGQGFYWLELDQAAEFTCIKVLLETTARSNAVLWLEHNCNKEGTGISPHAYEPKRLLCFVYYQTTAFLEFKFHFSFRAIIEVTVYGIAEVPKKIPNPFHATEWTEAWYPTAKIIRWSDFMAYMSNYWNP